MGAWTIVQDSYSTWPAKVYVLSVCEYVVSVCHECMSQNAPYMCPAGGAKFGKDPKKTEPSLVKFGGGTQTQEAPDHQT